MEVKWVEHLQIQWYTNEVAYSHSNQEVSLEFFFTILPLRPYIRITVVPTDPPPLPPKNKKKGKRKEIHLKHQLYKLVLPLEIGQN